MIFKSNNSPLDFKVCFCLGKTGNDEECEDIIVQGEWFFAVIDGVTSKSDMTFEGKAPGRYAAELLANAILNMDKEVDVLSCFKLLDRAISGVYTHLPCAPENKVQACVIIYSRLRHEVWNYGDCQLMINENCFSHEKLIDKTLSTLRSFWISAYLLQGGSQESLLEKDVGRECILPFLKMQSVFSNTDGCFGYPVIDGMGINEKLIKIYPVKKGDFVVLASDGYPKLFPTLCESEEHLMKILEADPLSINENMQTKMKRSDCISFDDRSYLSFFVQ